MRGCVRGKVIMCMCFNGESGGGCGAGPDSQVEVN